jgi:hypothetical protein
MLFVQKKYIYRFGPLIWKLKNVNLTQINN